jgi:hypothetical protein
LLDVVLTGVAPVTGAVTPEIVAVVIAAFGVVIVADGADAVPVPTELVALTSNV